MNWKEFERKCRGLIGYNPDICPTRLCKITQKNRLRMTSVLSEIRTEHRVNTGLGRYRRTNLFGDTVSYMCINLLSFVFITCVMNMSELFLLTLWRLSPEIRMRMVHIFVPLYSWGSSRRSRFLCSASKLCQHDIHICNKKHHGQWERKIFVV
jgi:hypothetical protein